MAKPKPRDSVTIPGVNQDRPFKPRVNQARIEAYEAAERTLESTPDPRPSDYVRAKAAFVSEVLADTFPGQELRLQLDVRQIHDAFSGFWGYAFAAPADPLE